MDNRQRRKNKKAVKVRNRGRLLLFIVIIAAIILAIIFIPKAFSFKTPAESPTPSAQASVAPAPTLDPALPHAVDSTKPENLGLTSEVTLNGFPLESLKRANAIDFSSGDKYTSLEGVITFRSNNYRDTASSYGTVDIKEKKLSPEYWTQDTGSLSKGPDPTKNKTGPLGVWTGSGWTGQPLIVKWPDDIKNIMNIYPEKKAKAGLVEVIYATLDGNIYFLDLEDGSYTRDPIKIGMAFKGAGSLDPRGYPIMYVGAGDYSKDGDSPENYIISLIDGSVLYKFGATDPYSLRIWHAYDSATLVDAKTDTLIAPGENGIIYTFKLNTKFDKQAGTISVNPSEAVKMRYSTNRSSEESYWLGIEDSAVIWKNYMYVSDNGGVLMCIDLNTMSIIWAQDVLDDTNDTPVLEVSEDGTPYIYISTSLHWTQDENKMGQIPIWKINALTGEKVFETSYTCYTQEGVSGGVQGTIAIGKGNMSNLIIVPVSRTPNEGTGKLVALNKETGKEEWVIESDFYSWSSPAIIYDKEGNGYIVHLNSGGTMFLIEGATGEILDKINIGSNTEASPSIYGNTIVVGTRGQKICGVRIK